MVDCGTAVVSARHRDTSPIDAMPNTCAVSGCFGNETGVLLHRFPKDEQQRQKWADLCNRRTPVSAYSRICSVHFKDSDYERNLMYELLGIPVPKNKVKLKDGVLPTLRLPASAGKGRNFITSTIIVRCLDCEVVSLGSGGYQHYFMVFR